MASGAGYAWRADRMARLYYFGYTHIDYVVKRPILLAGLIKRLFSGPRVQRL